jgi:hypothetical protein
MQIHELTQPKKIKLDEIEVFGQDGLAAKLGDVWKTRGKSLISRDAEIAAEKERYAAQANKYAGQLQAQQTQAKSITLDQALAKLKADPSATQWINTTVAKWTPAADKIAADKKAKIGPASIDEAVTLDPKDPAQAAILAKMGDPRFQPPPPPVAPDPKQELRTDIKSWINSQLKTTSLEAIVKAENSGIDGLTGTSQRIKKELDDMVNQAGNETAQQTALKNILILATAANHVIAAQGQANTTPDPASNQQLMGRQPRVETGLDDNQIKALRQAASAAGGPPPKDTGNAFFNSLIAQIRGLG